MSRADSSREAIANQPDLVIPQLIVGLGNPGEKYDRTRHNVGFEAVDLLAKTWQISMAENRRFQGIYGEGRGPHGQKIGLLKPLTYMNRSGQAIRAVIDWFKLPPESVLVIYDDLDLPVGKIRLRSSGSAGGHNGMKSAIAHLKTQNFPRLRIGIDSPRAAHNSDKAVVSHVLGQFSKAESEVITDVLYLSRDAIELGLREGIAKAMSLYNNRSISINP
ncbi:MAG: aminoacyl-tRNA hydrolase [Synechococcales cyanobacterium T60_A2020_003]|nr:aminoacyl-tRNA hydrolase [Synechococcales cyanobacterium T60_A2020_003]